MASQRKWAHPSNKQQKGGLCALPNGQRESVNSITQMELQAAVNAITDFWLKLPALRHPIPPS
jgi:hypothetical protein